MNSVRTDDKPKNQHCILKKFLYIPLFCDTIYLHFQRSQSVPSNEVAFAVSQGKIYRHLRFFHTCCLLFPYRHFIQLVHSKNTKQISQTVQYIIISFCTFSVGLSSHTQVFPKHSVFQYHPILVLPE